jgi:hypothetical protein
MAKKKPAAAKQTAEAKRAKAKRAKAKKPSAAKGGGTVKVGAKQARPRGGKAAPARAKVMPRRPTRKTRAASKAAAKRIRPDGEATKNTAEENRGGQFFKKLRMWQILHERPGYVWNKQELAEALFKDGDIDCDPDDETAADEDSDQLEWVTDGPGGGHWKMKIRTKHKKDAQRQIEALKRMNIGVIDCDKNGNELTPAEVMERQQANKFEERYWKYDRDAKWARLFTDLRTTHLLSGSALVGLKTLADLLGPMQGSPHHQAVQGIVDRLFQMVPPALREEARQQARAWVHALGLTGKYIKQRAELREWYVATLLRKQVQLVYEKPGESYIEDSKKRNRVRMVAAFGTKYDAEESSLYLIGSEWEAVTDEHGKVEDRWSSPKQFKLDRVVRVQLTAERNPALADIPRHHLIKRDGVAVSSERLDLERLYSTSAGSYLSYDPPVDIEFLVESPTNVTEDLWRAANWAAWVQEKPFHPNQIVKSEDGGRRLRVVINRCNADEVISRMLRLGVDFQLLQPTELRSLVREKALLIADRHAGP